MKQLYYLFILAYLPFTAFASTPMTIASSGHMIVDVTLNDGIKAKFIIDTGAGGAVVPQSVFDQMNIPEKDVSTTIIQGATDTTQAKLFTLDKIQVGNAVVKDVPSVVQSGYRFEGINGELGILPQNFLNQFMVEFDLKNNQLLLHSKDSLVDDLYPNEAFTDIPLTFNRNSFIEFPISIQGQEISGHLDTGAGNHVLMTWKAANKIGISETDEDVTVISQARGASGEPFDIKGTGQPVDIKIGETILQNVDIAIADLPVFDLFSWTKGIVGNLGIGVFSGKRVLIDYKRKSLSFTQ